MTNQEAIDTIKANYPPEHYFMLREALDMALQLLKEQEAVVRCADCRHADISQCGLIKCRGIFRSKEWFCADGERR